MKAGSAGLSARRLALLGGSQHVSQSSRIVAMGSNLLPLGAMPRARQGEAPNGTG